MQPEDGLGRTSIAICTAALLCLGAADATASWWEVDHEDHRNWLISLSGGAFRQDIDGDVAIETAFGNGHAGVDTLDLDHDTEPWAEIDLQLFRRNHLRLTYLPIEFEGDTALSMPIRFAGQDFESGDRVTSRLRMDTYELSYRFDFYVGKWLTIAPLVQVSLVDGRIDVRDETLDEGYEESQLLPVPAIGLRAEFYPLARIGVFGEGKGFTIGKRGSMWDVQAGIRLHLIKNFSLMGSYRLVDYNIDYLDVDANVRTQGPFAGATLRF